MARKRYRHTVQAIRLVALVQAVLLAGCTGPQSALDAAGEEAVHLAELFWVMLAGAAVIWALVVGVAVFAGRFQKAPLGERAGLRLILWGGAVFPTVVLAGLLVHGLRLMPVLRAPGGDLRIDVVGEQFWWRLTYRPQGRPPVVSANEVRLPAGTRVEFRLDAADVIHSFWIPSLGGKMDMIPGRTNRLVLLADKPGVYRGACAEFCGTSHALMAFDVVVMEPQAFAAWLEREAADAPAGGSEAFIGNGCGACHTVRGIEAKGVIGPDLTHVGGRRSLGAGILPNTRENLIRFITETEAAKPGVRMPSFHALPPAEVAVIADYLGSLR
jgi:cytochrome c oxidase subunit 2